MDIENMANPAVADDVRVDTATAEAEPAVNTSDDFNPDTSEADAPLAASDDETEEVEFEGVKHRIPRALKGAFLRDADYRQKTMTLADQRREVEAKAQAVAETASRQTDNIKHYARLESLGEQVAQYSAVDWDALEQEDPSAAASAFRQYQTLKDAYQATYARIAQNEQQQAQEATQETAKRRTDTLAAVTREIPGWSPARQKELESIATENGYSPDYIEKYATAADYKLLHLADVGRKALAAQAAARRVAAQQAAPAAAEVGHKAAAVRKDPSRMSDDEWWQNRKKSKQ